MQMKAILALAIVLMCAVVSASDTNSVAPNLPIPGIFTRIVKVNDTPFLTNLKKVMPPIKGESDNQLLRRFLKQNNVEFEPPRTVYLSESRGLILYTTLEEIDRVEGIVAKVTFLKPKG